MENNLPDELSAKYKDSFAYKTVKDRLPVILTKVVDTAFRHRHEIQSTHGEEGWKDLQQIIGSMSEMRYRMVTDKPLIPLEDKHGRRSKDIAVWNKVLKDHEDKHGFAPSWFKSPWLLIECYMYRKIMECVENSQFARSFDPFGIQKEQAFVGAVNPINILAEHTVELIDNFDKQSLHANFINLMQICLWGNKCDLSISAGANAHHVACPLKQVDPLKPFILVDNSEKIFDYLTKDSKKERIDFILDNAGLEFFSDLCFAEYLLTAGLTKRIVFHCKALPWFVSDVTARDFSWTVEMLNCSDHKNLVRFASHLMKRQESGFMELRSHDFWTMPFAYYEMSTQAPDLYSDLSESDLLIFKGDLNYRKLVGDLNWPPTTPFGQAIRRFCPAPLIALRTLKADVVAGLKDGVAEELCKKDTNWMISGDYAVIEFFKL